MATTNQVSQESLTIRRLIEQAIVERGLGQHLEEGLLMTVDAQMPVWRYGLHQGLSVMSVMGDLSAMRDAIDDALRHLIPDAVAQATTQGQFSVLMACGLGLLSLLTPGERKPIDRALVEGEISWLTSIYLSARSSADDPAHLRTELIEQGRFDVQYRQRTQHVLDALVDNLLRELLPMMGEALGITALSEWRTLPSFAGEGGAEANMRAGELFNRFMYPMLGCEERSTKSYDEVQLLGRLMQCISQVIMLHLDIHNDWAFTDSGDLPRHIVNAWDGLRRVLTHRTAAWREVKQHLIATFITLCPQPT